MKIIYAIIWRVQNQRKLNCLTTTEAEEKTLKWIAKKKTRTTTYVQI